MNTDVATRCIQAMLGLNFNDALPLVKTARSGEARKERVLEIRCLVEKIHTLTDEELSATLDLYR